MNSCSANRRSSRGALRTPTPEAPGVTLVHDWEAFKSTIGPDDIIFASWGVHHDLAGRGRLLVFDHLDAFPDWVEVNQQMLAKADVVFYTSEALRQQIAAVGRRVPTAHVPNACDPELWRRSAACPGWLERLPKPRILFLGFPGFWVDRELIEYSARQLAAHAFVVVGPTAGLQSRQNLHLVGQRPYEDLPGILQHCQVAMVPFRSQDPTAQAADPIKAYEYLAAGLPTIATKLPELDKLPQILQATDPDNFVHLLIREYEQDTPARRQARRESVSAHTWAARAETIERVVARKLRRTATPPEPESVAILTPQFFGIEDQGKCFFGGAERYALDIADLCRDLGFGVEVFQPSNARWTKTYRGITFHGLGDCAFQYDQFEGANERFACATAGFDHHIYLNLEVTYPHVFPDSIGISHGIWWDYRERDWWRGEEWRRRHFRSIEQLQVVASCDTNSINWVRAENPLLASKFRYIPNHADMALYHPSELRKTGLLTVIFPRRLEVGRGLFLALEAADAIMDRHQHVRFLFVGRSSDDREQHVQRWCSSRPRSQWMWVEPHQMPEVYREADISIIPTTCCEGTSYSAIESMATGLATICTHVGGLGNLVIDGYNGLLIEPTAASLTEAIDRLVTDSALRTHLGVMGRESVAASFSREVWRRRWTRLIGETWS